MDGCPWDGWVIGVPSGLRGCPKPSPATGTELVSIRILDLLRFADTFSHPERVAWAKLTKMVRVSKSSKNTRLPAAVVFDQVPVPTPKLGALEGLCLKELCIVLLAAEEKKQRAGEVERWCTLL